jgi:hypothetical protein
VHQRGAGVPRVVQARKRQLAERLAFGPDRNENSFLSGFDLALSRAGSSSLVAHGFCYLAVPGRQRHGASLRCQERAVAMANRLPRHILPSGPSRTTR